MCCSWKVRFFQKALLGCPGCYLLCGFILHISSRGRNDDGDGDGFLSRGNPSSFPFRWKSSWWSWKVGFVQKVQSGRKSHVTFSLFTIECLVHPPRGREGIWKTRMCKIICKLKQIYNLLKSCSLFHSPHPLSFFLDRLLPLLSFSLLPLFALFPSLAHTPRPDCVVDYYVFVVDVVVLLLLIMMWSCSKCQWCCCSLNI